MPKPWTKAELEILKKHYPESGVRDTIEALRKAGYQRSYNSVKVMAQKKGIKVKTPVRFETGQQPWNKGLKYNERQRQWGAKGWFKKGNSPHTEKHDGAISWRMDNCNNRYYAYIRLSKSKWELYHRYLWEQANGPIPQDHLVRFKDNDTTNLQLDNLEIVSRTEHGKEALEKNGHPSKDLTDNYVKAMMMRFKGFKEEQISPEMIELYRAQLLLQREIKKQQS